jgi:hypothetical protein
MIHQTLTFCSHEGSFTRIGNVASAPLTNIITNRTSFRRVLVILSSASTASLRALGRYEQINERRRLDWSSLFDQPGGWEPCCEGHESNDSKRPGWAKTRYQAIHGEADGRSS